MSKILLSLLIAAPYLALADFSRGTLEDLLFALAEQRWDRETQNSDEDTLARHRKDLELAVSAIKQNPEVLAHDLKVATEHVEFEFSAKHSSKSFVEALGNWSRLTQIYAWVKSVSAQSESVPMPAPAELQRSYAQGAAHEILTSARLWVRQKWSLFRGLTDDGDDPASPLEALKTSGKLHSFTALNGFAQRNYPAQLNENLFVATVLAEALDIALVVEDHKAEAPIRLEFKHQVEKLIALMGTEFKGRSRFRAATRDVFAILTDALRTPANQAYLRIVVSESVPQLDVSWKESVGSALREFFARRGAVLIHEVSKMSCAEVLVK